MPEDDVNPLRRRLAALLPTLALAPVAHGQDAVQVQSRAYRVALENEWVRVLEFHSRPGMGICGTGMHSHPAHLTIALSAAKVRVRLPDGRSILAENQPGDVVWSEAETHETENLTGTDVRALIVELKDTRGR